MARPLPARSDEDPAVHPELRPVAAWLADPDPVVRAFSAFDLRHYRHPGAVTLLARVVEREADPIVLGCALGSLAGRPREDLVAEGGAALPGLLLRLLGHEHAVVRDRAWEAIRGIPDALPAGGADRAEAVWQRWWLAHRGALEREQADLRPARAAAAAAPPPSPGASPTVQAPRHPVYEHVARRRHDLLQLCLVLDDTGSMAAAISAAKRAAADLVDELAWLVPGFQAALVTYKDGAYKALDFTSDARQLEKALGRIAAAGGGDWEEGVDQGIRLALRGAMGASPRHGRDVLAWGRRAHRVLVVIGDAPPHDSDVDGLLRFIRMAREDERYEKPAVVHTVSVQSSGVEYFGAIAEAGAGAHVELSDMARLQRVLVSLAYGGGFHDRLDAWLTEVAHLRRHDRREARRRR